MILAIAVMSQEGNGMARPIMLGIESSRDEIGAGLGRDGRPLGRAAAEGVATVA